MKSSGLSVRKMTSASLLIALGIMIPMFMPLKVIIEPASFTLASHLPVFLSMFISPFVAVAVSLGTALGFALGPFTPIITLRAASHVIFAFLGASFLKRKPQILNSILSTQIFSLCIGLVHAFCEFVVATAFYFSGAMAVSSYNKGFFFSIFLMVGVGGLVHSMVDFILALAVRKVLIKQPTLKGFIL